MGAQAECIGLADRSEQVGCRTAGVCLRGVGEQPSAEVGNRARCRLAVGLGTGIDDGPFGAAGAHELVKVTAAVQAEKLIEVRGEVGRASVKRLELAAVKVEAFDRCGE